MAYANLPSTFTFNVTGLDPLPFPCVVNMVPCFSRRGNGGARTSGLLLYLVLLSFHPIPHRPGSTHTAQVWSLATHQFAFKQQTV